MRAKNVSGDLTVKAIAGTHVVLLGMNMPKTACDGLLGFAIQRTDHTENEIYWLEGMKIFASVPVDFLPGNKVSTRKHPVQGFTWSDFSAKPNHNYTYRVVALKGQPADPTESESTEVEVTTEPEQLDNGHEVYFNRGASASQAYAARFQNQSPDLAGPAAFLWLSRGLHEALIGFIERAQDNNWGLRVAAYEFTEESVLIALRDAAQERAVDVKIVYHARERDDTEIRTVFGVKKEVKTQTGANRAAVMKAEIEDLCKERVAPAKSDISHNKFIVLLHEDAPVAVLTGSTNFSKGGIYGHSNVVHVVNDAGIADQYLNYWKELFDDPNKQTLRPKLDSMCDIPAPPLADNFPPSGTTTVFSPRSETDALTYYQALAARAEKALFMTFAFGMNALFQSVYQTSTAPTRFTLMEKAVLPLKDKVKQAQQEQIIIDLRKLVENRFGIGGTMPLNVLEHWANEKLSGLNPMVKYLHTKYMLVDPLGDDPIVVSGSANFSDASCNTNDENMLIVRGDTRIADIYLGEFMRLYKHFAFRDWLTNALAEGEIQINEPLPVEFLDETNQWWRKWFAHTGYSNERQYFSA
jgi:phosphatidylserine/phosphatidylglycerophosphate/cardiolipin synthase-like enzyme